MSSSLPAVEPRRAPRARAFAFVLAAWFAIPAAAQETAMLHAPTPVSADEFAYAADVDATTLVVGAPGENASAGAIYAIDCATPPCAAPLRVAPGDLGDADLFGSAVAISGDTLAASAPGVEPGAVYVFVRNGAIWQQQARLTPSGAATGERFGVAIALAGDRLAVGADRAEQRAGVVYVFVRSGGVWTQEARLSASDAATGAHFGMSLALDGDTLLAGAPFRAPAVQGVYASGAAYVFVRDAGGWSEQARLESDPNATAAMFGFAVALDGDRAAVGAPREGNARGAAYLFARSGTAWSQQTSLIPEALADGDEFGWSVALAAGRVLVGAPFSGLACGRTTVFDDAGGELHGAAATSAPALEELTGWSLAASGDRWIASAPGRAFGSDDHAGAAHWFDATITVFGSGFDVVSTCTPAAQRGGSLNP